MTAWGAMLAVFAAISAASAQDAAPPAPLPVPGGCPPEQPAFVMPTTGIPFTLPLSTEGETSAEPGPCEPVSPPPVRPPAPSLFRMVAVPVASAGPTAKWNDARLGHLEGQSGPWRELLSEVRRLSRDPLPMVNQWVNWTVQYRDDPPGDEWATASTTLSRGFGDCEDFAVAKMGLLAALGVSPDDMYLVLLRDQRQTDHAVLAVMRDGRMLVLDNRTDKILPADSIADYTPILSFSGPFAWTYGERTG